MTSLIWTLLLSLLKGALSLIEIETLTQNPGYFTDWTNFNHSIQTSRRYLDLRKNSMYLRAYTTNQHRFRNQMKPLISMCLLSIALSSCGQTDNRTECARLLTIRKNSNSDHKIKASEIRMELSKRVKLPPDHVDLFCIHYLGKTPVMRRISTSATSKPLKI